MPPQRNSFERHRVLTLGLTVGVAVVALDFGAAALAKALGGYRPVRESVQESTRHYRRPDPMLHHVLIPKVDFDGALWGERRYRIRTNSLGFKDRSTREVALVPDGARVVFIGDSFIEGIGFEYDETAVGHLDRQFAARGTEVLNAAVASYSPILYLRKTRHLLEDVGLRFDRLVVFIDLSDIEDEASSYAFDEQGNVIAVGGGWAAERRARRERDEQRWRFRHFLAEHTVLLGRVVGFPSRVRRALRGERERARTDLEQHRALWTVDDALYREFGAEGLRVAMGHMTELQQLLSARGIALTVVVYPWPDQIVRRDLDSRQVRAWRDWAAQHDSQFIDLFPAFIDGSDPAQVLSRYFVPGDVHWNAKGHERVAEAFLREHDRLNGPD